MQITVTTIASLGKASESCHTKLAIQITVTTIASLGKAKALLQVAQMTNATPYVKIYWTLTDIILH